MRNSVGGSMVSFEIILKTSKVILLQDPFYEVVSITYGYTLLHGSHPESSGKLGSSRTPDGSHGGARGGTTQLFL